MHRIDGAGHVWNLFVNEDPLTNRPPTEFTADWFNDLQENICRLTESLGEELIKGDFDQLRRVIGRGIGRVVNSIEELRNLDKHTVFSAFALGFHEPGDGGGGRYYQKSSSGGALAHNGGVDIGAYDDAWWRLIHYGRVSICAFGVVADYDTAEGVGTDNAAAIDRAIAYSAANHVLVSVPDGFYYTSKPLNMGSSVSDHRHGAKLAGTGKPDIFGGIGAVFYVGSGASCIEIIDSYHCVVSGLGFVGIGNTCFGVVLSRGVHHSGVGHHLLRDCVVYVNSEADSERCSVGVLNVACEETILDNCDVWAEIPYVGVHKNEINLAHLDGSGLPDGEFTTWGYASYYGTPLVSVASSNTVFRVTGQGRFIALNSRGPNVLLETASDVDLGHTFMQRVPDPVVTVPQGNYQFGFQLLSVFGLNWAGTIEHCESMALVFGEVDNANIDCTLGSESNVLAELVFYEPAAGVRKLKNNEITIRGNVAKAPALCVRNAIGDNLFRLEGTTIKTSSPHALSVVDGGFWSMLNIAKNTVVEFDNTNIVCNSGSFTFEKVVFHSVSDVLFDIYMPDSGAEGAFYITAKAECVTSNVVESQASESICMCDAYWVGANSVTGFGPFFDMGVESVRAVNFNPSISDLAGLVASTNVNATSGRVSFVVTPTISGSSVQPLMTKAKIRVTVARRDDMALFVA